MEVRVHPHAPAVLPQGKAHFQLSTWLGGSQRHSGRLAEDIKLFSGRETRILQPVVQ